MAYNALTMQNAPIFVSLLVSAFLSFTAALMAWRQRIKASAPPLALLSLCTGIWSLFYALEINSANLGGKYFWAVAKFPAVVTIPIALGIFILRFAGWQTWPTKKVLASLCIVPTATTLVIFTNPCHHLFWESVSLKQFPGFIGLVTENSIWYWVLAVYSYGFLLVAFSVAFSQLSQMWHIHKRQALKLLVGISIPVAGNLLSVLKAHPWPGLDISPFTFGISAVFLLTSTRLTGILNVVPLAHSLIIEQLRDGVLVLNNENIIVEVNRAAESIIGTPRQALLGKNIQKFDIPATRMLQPGSDQNTLRHEVMLEIRDQSRWFDIRVSAIYHEKGLLVGRMIL